MSKRQMFEDVVNHVLCGQLCEAYLLLDRKSVV